MLERPHQGYIYQDILGAYLFSKEISAGALSTEFRFDRKSSDGDLFDDIVEIRGSRFWRKQVKYSESTSQHVFTESDLRNRSKGIALFDLYRSWYSYRDNTEEIRLCLCWKEPVEGDEIKEILSEVDGFARTFEGTKIYQIDIDRFWPEGAAPKSSWRSFGRNASGINRDDFKEFLEALVIEVGLPESSRLSESDDDLEIELLRELEKIGIGEYPNQNLAARRFALELANQVRNFRADTGEVFSLRTGDIARKCGLHFGFGGLPQNFPVNEQQLVATEDFTENIQRCLQHHNKVLVLGEPGSGKSWSIESLCRAFDEETRLLRHYCYTGLDDPLAVERITPHALWGSLIEQLLESFPELEEHKYARYASSLDELNLMLAYVDRPTILIVDGLDHVDRVYRKFESDLAKNEVTILDSLEKIELNNNLVKILLFSQPTEQARQLDGFFHLDVSPWTEYEIVLCLDKADVPNLILENGRSLSTHIAEKSRGNALYISYIVRELRSAPSPDMQWLFDLPEYDFNLKGYYSHLLTAVDEESSVMFSLCGAWFSLTLEDIEEITGLGTRVDKALSSLSPVLRYSSANNGYSIYHESFKRYLMQRMEEDRVDIIQNTLVPVKNWLSTKDFWSFDKAYWYYLPILLETECIEPILETISTLFVRTSLISGHPIAAIQQNHRFQALAVEHSSVLEHLVTLSEQSKLVHELTFSETEEYVNYLVAVHQIYGPEKMYGAIIEDGEVIAQNDTLAYVFIELAYSGISPEWSYLDYSGQISETLFRSKIVQLLQKSDYDKIESLLNENEDSESNNDSFHLAQDEVYRWCHSYRLKFDPLRYPSITRCLSWYKARSECSELTISKLIELSGDLIRHAENHDSQDVICTIGEMRNIARRFAGVSLNELTNALQPLSDKNWFYNWAIFCILCACKAEGSFADAIPIETIFSYLSKDVEPLKGNPSSSDLYALKKYIQESYFEGLSLCETEAEMEHCFEHLERATRTTFSIQNSYSGPLTDEYYLYLCETFLQPDKAVEQYTRKYSDIVESRTYGCSAETAFRFGKLYAEAGEIGPAIEYLGVGVRFMTAYGFRKDRTLSELVDSATDYFGCYGGGQIELKKIYLMAQALRFHTNGKGTRHYAIEWFDEYSKLFPDMALQFLASEMLSDLGGNYHHEQSLLNYLYRECDNFPLASYLIMRTFPIEISERFVRSATKMPEKLPAVLRESGLQWLRTVEERIGLDKHVSYADEVLVSISRLSGSDLGTLREKATKSSYVSSGSAQGRQLEEFGLSIASSFDSFLSVMSDSGILDVQFKDQVGTLQQLGFKDKKNYIVAVVAADKYRLSRTSLISDMFSEKSEEWVFLNIELFVTKANELFTKDAIPHFLLAYAAMPQQSVRFLFESVSRRISKTDYVNRLTSSLISALSKANAPHEMVRPLWEVAYQMISDRIPTPMPDKHLAPISDDLNAMSIEELMVCCLLTRLNTITVERSHQVLYGINILLSLEPQKLVKPIVWFVNSNTKTPAILLSSLIQLIYERDKPFLALREVQKSLAGIYPTHYFHTDFMIESVCDFPPSGEYKPNTLVEFLPDPNDERFLRSFNLKYSWLSHWGICIDGIKNEYSVKRDSEKEFLRQYWNSMVNRLTDTVFHSNLIFCIIQNRYYESIRQVSQCIGDPVYNALRVLVDDQIINVASRTKRPVGIVRPSEVEIDSELISPAVTDNWIRIGLVERERLGSYQEEHSDIYRSELLVLGKRDFAVVRNPLYDPYELGTMLSLREDISEELGLAYMPDSVNGFGYKNDSGEIVVRYDSWVTEYVGADNLNDEIPRLAGAQMLLRVDYGAKLRSILAIDELLVSQDKWVN